MRLKEFRIPMPISVEEYKIGQLYMIAKHSHEQSEAGSGVEVVHNVPHKDPEHGAGQYTEKRIHLTDRLPYWAQAITPRVFYITEKAWNYYPYTETEYTCSFIPKLNIFIKTRYENNAGTTENVLGLSPEELDVRTVEHLDIAYDEVSPKHYKENEDPKFFKSKVTGRGPLKEGWQEREQPVMCSYKLVKINFEVWGLQTRVEEFVAKAIKDILLLGHRQAFAWIDEWMGMSVEDVREYEKKMQEETNLKVLSNAQACEDGEVAEEVKEEDDTEKGEGEGFKSAETSPTKETAPSLPTAPTVSESGSTNPVAAAASGIRSWLTWST